MSQALAKQLRSEGIKDKRVLQAIAATPRKQFVIDEYIDHADADQPLPIGYEQTISQPYVVARMTELLLDHFQPKNVLEIGTGSGYQAAVLAALVDQVYSIERIEALYQQAEKNLNALNYQNIKLIHADGMLGLSEYAPFDAIMLTAAIEHIPQLLLSQLGLPGKMVLPLGNPASHQYLCVLTKTAEHTTEQALFDPVRFVPILPGKK